MSDYVELVEHARKAAEAAVTKRITELKEAHPDRHYDHHGCCGFAWVEVPLGRHPFITAMRRATREFVKSPETVRNPQYESSQLFGERQDYGTRAWQFWNPSGYSGQSIDIKDVGAQAFAAVLQEAGIKAHVRSRLD